MSFARAVTLSVLVMFAVCAARGVEPTPDSPRKAAELLTVRGQVVWMYEALARRHGVRTVPEAAQRVLALETSDGQLHPLVEDVRGRGFRRDERLRSTPVELLVRRHPGSPMLQVIRVFALAEDGKYELDYWCDICAIAMFESKPCDCCQDPNVLRRRKASDNSP